MQLGVQALSQSEHSSEGREKELTTGKNKEAQSITHTHTPATWDRRSEETVLLKIPLRGLS